MAVTEQKQNLITLLAETSQVDAQVTKYITDTIGCQSIADFANLFTTADYEEGVSKEILDKTAHKDSVLQRGRLRASWRLASAQFAAATERVRKAEPGQEDDLDKPLQKEVYDAQVQAARTVHVPVFSSVLTPSDSLFGRCYREFRKRTISVFPLNKVRSLEYQGTVIPKSRKTQLAPGVALDVAPDADLPGEEFRSVLEVLVALQILVNAWALTGTEVTRTREEPKIEGLDGDYNEGIAYYGFVLDKAMTHPGPLTETVAWILDRDRQTRTKARTLIGTGLPWGKALRLSWEHHVQVLWTVGGVGAKQLAPQTITDRNVTLAADKERDSERQQAKSSRPWRADQCCPDYNSHGCGRQKTCPQGLWHACSYTHADGTICAAQHHTKVEHIAKERARNYDAYEQQHKGQGKNQRNVNQGKKGKAQDQGKGAPHKKHR